MTIRMISIRRHLLKSDNKEYNKDDPFTVADAREADQLVRRGRARRAPTERTVTPSPPSPAVEVSPPPSAKTGSVRPPAAARSQVQPPPPTAVEPMTTDNTTPLFDPDSRPVRQRYARRPSED